MNLDKGFEKQNNDWEVRRNEIERQIVYLRLVCISKDEEKEYGDMLEQFQGYKKDDDGFIRISNEERRRIEYLDNKLKESTLELFFLHELKYALEMLHVDEESIKHYLAHENAHGNLAESLGVEHLRYEIVFRRDELNIQIKPMCFHSAEGKYKDLSPEEQREFDFKYSTAPRLYGEVLSPGDKNNARSAILQIVNKSWEKNLNLGRESNWKDIK